MMDQTSEWKIEICDVCCKEEGEPMLEDLLKRLEILKMLKFAAANTLEEVALKSSGCANATDAAIFAEKMQKTVLQHRTLHDDIYKGQLAVAKFTSILNKKKELLALLEEKKANLEGTAEINGVISAHLKQHLVAETKHVLAHRYAAAAQLCRSFHLQSTLTSHGLVESETLGSLRGVSCFNSISAKLKTTEGPDAITSAKYEASEPAEITSVVLQSIVHLLDTLVHVLHIPLPHGMHPYYTPGISAISPSHSSERLLLSPGIPSSTTTGDSDKTFSRTPAPWLVKESSDSLLSHSSHEALPCVHSSAHYARALSLLQANILVACLKMGIKPSACKPPEAILHNMRSLHFCCEYRAKKTQQDLLVSCDRNNMNACATEPIARCTAIQPLCPSERYPCPERVLQYSDMLESSTHPHTSQPSPQDAPSGPLFDSSATTGEDDWAVVTLTSKM